jgi:hypothetical protein
MSDYPADLQRVAKGIWCGLADKWDHTRRSRKPFWSDEENSETIARAISAERDRCAKFADAWDSPSALRLAAGEMTAQEMRTARAVARGIAAAIRDASLTPERNET